jgi:hypothetical protein
VKQPIRKPSGTGLCNGCMYYSESDDGTCHHPRAGWSAGPHGTDCINTIWVMPREAEPDPIAFLQVGPVEYCGMKLTVTEVRNGN